MHLDAQPPTGSSFPKITHTTESGLICIAMAMFSLAISKGSGLRLSRLRLWSNFVDWHMATLLGNVVEFLFCLHLFSHSP